MRDPAYLCSQMHNVRGVIVVTRTPELRARVHRRINDSIPRTFSEFPRESETFPVTSFPYNRRVSFDACLNARASKRGKFG